MRKKMIAVLAIVLTALIALPLLSVNALTGTAANKAGAASAVIDVEKYDTEITLLSTTAKWSGTKDLHIQVSAETSIVTAAKIQSGTTSQSEAEIVVWVEIDGQPVVLGDDDDGKVTFNQRLLRITTATYNTLYVPETLAEVYIATKSAHSFDWIAPNVGTYGDTNTNIHTIEVKAELTRNSVNAPDASAIIGKRIMVVEPIQMMNGFTLFE